MDINSGSDGRTGRSAASLWDRTWLAAHAHFLLPVPVILWATVPFYQRVAQSVVYRSAKARVLTTLPGLSIADVQEVIAMALGAEAITHTVEGRARYNAHCAIRRPCDKTPTPSPARCRLPCRVVAQCLWERWRGWNARGAPPRSAPRTGSLLPTKRRTWHSRSVEYCLAQAFAFFVGPQDSRSHCAPSERFGTCVRSRLLRCRSQTAPPASTAKAIPPQRMASRLRPVSQPPPAPPVPTRPAAIKTGQMMGTTSGAQQAAQAATVPVMASFRETIGSSTLMPCLGVTLKATLRAR